MHNPAFQIGYKQSKEEAFADYKNTGQIWCPALGDFVAFNRLGFQHLIRFKKRQRPKSEQVRRFLLLPTAKEILGDPNSKAEHHRKEIVDTGKARWGKIPKFPYADYWEFTGKRDGRIIKVIVRQFPEGRKHFLSVYEKKEKSRS